MSRLHQPLDPTKTGRDAESLDRTLRRMVVGQDEAIDQIVNMYQMYLDRDDRARASDREFSLFRTHGFRQDADSGGARGSAGT